MWLHDRRAEGDDRGLDRPRKGRCVDDVGLEEFPGGGVAPAPGLRDVPAQLLGLPPPALRQRVVARAGHLVEPQLALRLVPDALAVPDEVDRAPVPHLRGVEDLEGDAALPPRLAADARVRDQLVRRRGVLPYVGELQGQRSDHGVLVVDVDAEDLLPQVGDGEPERLRGKPGGRLVAVLHRPLRSLADGGPVVLLHPGLHERVADRRRGHRLAREVAQEVAVRHVARALEEEQALPAGLPVPLPGRRADAAPLHREHAGLGADDRALRALALVPLQRGQRGAVADAGIAHPPQSCLAPCPVIVAYIF
mmetsp:Transcript_14691/g.42008  ORF Transcript_14691/g.42008 Transcript_14691/m.42008 type:complete len:308 (-) Transcript_14691:14-937(-)